MMSTLLGSIASGIAIYAVVAHCVAMKRVSIVHLHLMNDFESNKTKELESTEGNNSYSFFRLSFFFSLSPQPFRMKCLNRH